MIKMTSFLKLGLLLALLAIMTVWQVQAAAINTTMTIPTETSLDLFDYGPMHEQLLKEIAEQETEEMKLHRKMWEEDPDAWMAYVRKVNAEEKGLNITERDGNWRPSCDTKHCVCASVSFSVVPA